MFRRWPSTAADLISQVNTASSADITNVYAAAGTILYPYYTGGATRQADHPHHQRDL